MPQLPAAEFFRVADHPTLGPAKGQIDHRGLPGHERGQCRYLGLGHVRVIADAAFARTPHVAMQYPEPVKCLRRAVIHVDRKPDMDHPFGVDQEVDYTFLESIGPGQGPLELLSCIDEEVETLSALDRCIHASPRLD